jgi:hypothetical protein
MLDLFLIKSLTAVKISEKIKRMLGNKAYAIAGSLATCKRAQAPVAELVC